MIDYKQKFLDLYRDVANCEAPEGTQVDDVLAEHQETFRSATKQPPNRYCVLWMDSDGDWHVMSSSVEEDVCKEQDTINESGYAATTFSFDDLVREYETK